MKFQNVYCVTAGLKTMNRHCIYFKNGKFLVFSIVCHSHQQIQG